MAVTGVLTVRVTGESRLLRSLSRGVASTLVFLDDRGIRCHEPAQLPTAVGIPARRRQKLPVLGRDLWLQVSPFHCFGRFTTTF